MEPKPIPKSIDADIVQCKADVLRARNAAMAAQKGKPSPNAPGPQARENAEPDVQPQGPDEGVQALLQMAAELQDPPKPYGGSSVTRTSPARQSSPLPAALRPVAQARVGNEPASKPPTPAALRPLNPANPGGSPNIPSAKPTAESRADKAPNPDPQSDSTHKKIRIPRFEEIVSWGKRILEDRPKTEAASDKPTEAQSAELDRLRQDIEQTRSAKQELDGQVVRLQSELASMTHSMSRARDQLRDNADTAEQLYIQIEHLQQKDGEQVGQLSDLRQQLSKRQTEIEEAIRNLQDSAQIQAQSQEQIQSLQTQLAARNKELTDLQTQLKQLQTTLEQTQTQLQTEIKFRNELQSSTDQVAQVNQRLQETVAANTQLQGQLAVSETALAEIRSQLETRQQEMAWFRDELKTAQQLAEQRQQQIEALGKVADERTAAQQLAETRQARIDLLQGQQDQLQQRIDGLEKEILRLQTESTALQDNHGKQSQQLDEARQEVARLHDRIQSQLATQSAVETELAQVRQQAIDNEGLRKNLQEQAQNLTGQLESAAKDLQDARSQLGEVKELWAQSQIQTRKIQEETDQLRNDLKTARQELESSRLELADLGSRQHGLQEQLQMESFLAGEPEPEDEFSELAESPLDVMQLESDMDRQLEPEGRMEWMKGFGTRPSLSGATPLSPDEAESQIAEEGPSIPVFNLGEQILAEQRKISAGRRQRSVDSPRSGPRVSGPRGIGHVVQSISPAELQRPAPVPPITARPVEPAWVKPADTLSSIQQEILAEIVAAEINRFCGR
jgi:chromosome segregation ATPase